MKKLILILLSIVILSIKSILFAQGLTEPFIVSPFIGEKLDRIEENYFNLCPEIKNFQEATFYLNPNSSLTLLTKFKQNNQLIDTTIAYRYSLSELRHHIYNVILTDIKRNRVEELGLSDSVTSYQGIIYSFDGKQIRLIENKLDNSDVNNANQDYLHSFNYSDVRTVTISESTTAVKIMSSLLGMLVGGLIGTALTPEPKHTESFPEAFIEPFESASESMANTFIGIGIGGLLGFIIGAVIQVPVEYNAMDPGTKTIVYENRLLSNSK